MGASGDVTALVFSSNPVRFGSLEKGAGEGQFVRSCQWAPRQMLRGLALGPPASTLTLFPDLLLE